TVGRIGTWGHGGSILAALDQIPDEIEVVGLAKVLPEDNPESLRQKFKTCVNAPIFENYDRLLKEARPQVVVVSTRLDQIAPAAIAAAKAGCHLFCEKPLALRHEDLNTLHAAVKAAHVQCLAILGNCARPALQAARKAVQDGLIGEIILCNARKSYRFGTDRPIWFGQRDLYGGTIPWVGIHGLDFIESATGLHFTEVAAMQGNLSHPEYPDCEDHCALILGLTNGGHATMSLDFLRPSGAPSHGDDWLRVVGSRGVIEAYLARNTCTLITENQPPVELPLPEPVNFFVNLVRKLRDDPAALAEATLSAFHLTRVCLCARDSADRRQVISIPLP
ncbi:MAG: Gfo/Idh/MocA family oxidoreductase, partial [Kiritimatiellia bacterium]|nr:Gfo/Idh/MocA family oxidoreductase [Kiritimatiellia bacterium]